MRPSAAGAGKRGFTARRSGLTDATGRVQIQGTKGPRAGRRAVTSIVQRVQQRHDNGE